MQKQAKQFIDLLETQQLLSPDIVEELRRQVAESKTRLTTELLAKLLVDNGHLTKFQATKLIAEMKQPDTPVDAEEDELGFAPADGPDANADVDGPPVATVFMDDDGDEVEVVEIDDGDIVDVQPIEVAEPIAEAEAVDAVPVAAGGGVESEADFSAAPKPLKAVQPRAVKANPWDSFRILGVGLTLALFLVAGFFLVYYFWRGSADERLQRADDAYEQRSYETAATMYREFSEVFPANPNASYAKVRAALAALRKVSEGAPDPQLGLQTAQEVLPGIAGEAGLADQRSDLAGALIALATKFNERADRTSEIAERKELMQDMDALMALINDPQFVGANQRNQQAPTLNRIQEDRQRILREINRDEELAAALGDIDQKLEGQDTLAAYDVRKALINRYPLLEADPALAERLQQATVIQRSLVKPGTLNVQLSQQAPSSVVGRSFVLASSSGGQAPALADQVLFVKVKGSVYGMEAASGRVLWRQYVGREFNSDPIPLGKSASNDALLCQPEKGTLTRVASKSGATVWHADLGQPSHRPQVESEDLFLATFDGTIASLDLAGGQTKWATKLPQPTPVAPGVAFAKPNLYAPAEHSNLYVISRTDGSCREVFYLGHRAGSIVVPPILSLGQLFVFENINASSAKIRILATSEDGLELRDAQVPITMEGNIVAAPQVDGRRLIVQSDVGQILVLDIEPTVESQRVTTIASIPKNASEPRLSWLVADSNRVWVADSRFTRFDLQVTLGKLDRAWIKNDGDRFIGPPHKFGDVIVHTRTLRGNQGVRVAAVDAASGDPLWETDLGIPVTMMAAAESGFDALNSSGMAYKFETKEIRNEADVNAGEGKSAMLFTHPVRLTDGRAVLFNQSRANQLALYDPQGPKLRLLSANLSGAVPSSQAVAVGTRVVVGLDNGQLVMLDPTNGSIVGTPYQPTLEAGRKVRWNTPAYLAAEQTLVAASDLGKLVRLSVGEDGLRGLSEVTLESPLVGPLVPVGKQVAGVQSTGSGDRLQFFDQTSLAAGPTVALPGRVIAGPWPLSERCLLQTDAELMAFTAAGEASWTLALPKSELVAAPTEVDGKLFVASRSGGVWVLDAASGQQLGQVEAGQPLSSAPLVLPAGLLVGSDEGAVLAIPVPTSQSETP